ncbi:MAG: hypothetical protein Q9219_006268 [cf. Caloplaca sp. 3 TL-2023]
MPATTATFRQRALSPVRFEILNTGDEEIYCFGSDAEETSEGRRNKRRRVEHAAQEYMRAKSLYIASARLKGPFPRGWKNPYVSKRRNDAVSLSETGNPSQPRKVAYDQNPAVARWVQDHGIQTAEHQSEIKTDVSTPGNHAEVSAKRTRNPSDIRDLRPNNEGEVGFTQDSYVTATSEPRTGADLSKPAKFSDVKTEKWLRTIHPHTEPDFNDGPRSPSPTPASRMRRLSLGHIISHESQATKKRNIRNVSPALSDIEAHRAKRLSLTGVLSPTRRPGTTVQSSDLDRRRDRDSLHSLPSSTNLPGFKYRNFPENGFRFPKRESPEKNLEAIVKAGGPEEKRRISFTDSGNIKRRQPQPSFGNHQPGSAGLITALSWPPHKELAEESPVANIKRARRPEVQGKEGFGSHQIEALPEAQIVPQPGLRNDRSVPSTDLLETEKLSLKFGVSDEGDSYHNLSTQAAVLHAQRSLQHDLASPIKVLGNQQQGAAKIDNHDEQESRDEGKPPSALKPELQSPIAMDDEPISTQAMLNAVSPFIVSTIKKRLPTEGQYDMAGSESASSPPLSPTSHEFRVTSLSMSTSPSESPCPVEREPPLRLSALSKPTSTITSLSIAPNGTMTEIMQYDGQQQQNYQMGDLDLDAALEEAGSFLGDWSVEKEAKQLERSTGGSKASAAKVR